MKPAVLYLRVSTTEQTTANQERELREIAGRMGCEIVEVYKDHGISGAKRREKRPAFDRMCRDAAKRQFDMVMAWSVDRLGRTSERAKSRLKDASCLSCRNVGLKTLAYSCRGYPRWEPYAGKLHVRICAGGAR